MSNEPSASLIAAMTGATSFPTEDGITQVEWRDVGMLPISTGQIVACDPLTFVGPRPLDRTIEPGEYPLRVLIAHYLNEDQRIAAAVLVVEHSQFPHSWQMATTEGESRSKLKPGEIYGYPVDSGTAGFLDLATAKALDAVLLEDFAYLEKILDDLQANYEPTRSWTIHPIQGDLDLCLSAFSSGVGDGSYPCYWGLDTDGHVVWLLTEFDLL
ncbi:DUF4241 domain-containing protein [Blastopirellula marina]|uniref:DUF4241 domain-containing protein n=1 Tax=Blastopirellula marina TaxID=124 RepID=A0A2S8GUM0_9BACT|nr:DUF4241 domain-containing protein [Blastopirellula marina]PQO48110.1 hypothetical protein C5Y93_00055 [Blastopirellula marina]